MLGKIRLKSWSNLTFHEKVIMIGCHWWLLESFRYIVRLDCWIHGFKMCAYLRGQRLLT